MMHFPRDQSSNTRPPSKRPSQSRLHIPPPSRRVLVPSSQPSSRPAERSDLLYREVMHDASHSDKSTPPPHTAICRSTFLDPYTFEIRFGTCNLLHSAERTVTCARSSLEPFLKAKESSTTTDCDAPAMYPTSSAWVSFPSGENFLMVVGWGRIRGGCMCGELEMRKAGFWRAGANN
ncbi:hypothetical protein BJX62DRAFT_121958 [Aspergillus germanicus]